MWKRRVIDPFDCVQEENAIFSGVNPMLNDLLIDNEQECLLKADFSGMALQSANIGQSLKIQEKFKLSDQIDLTCAVIFGYLNSRVLIDGHLLKTHIKPSSEWVASTYHSQNLLGVGFVKKFLASKLWLGWYAGARTGDYQYELNQIFCTARYTPRIGSQILDHSLFLLTLASQDIQRQNGIMRFSWFYKFDKNKTVGALIQSQVNPSQHGPFLATGVDVVMPIDEEKKFKVNLSLSAPIMDPLNNYLAKLKLYGYFNFPVKPYMEFVLSPNLHAPRWGFGIFS